jgi:hypothetical protein
MVIAILQSVETNNVFVMTIVGRRNSRCITVHRIEDIIRVCKRRASHSAAVVQGAVEEVKNCNGVLDTSAATEMAFQARSAPPVVFRTPRKAPAKTKKDFGLRCARILPNGKVCGRQCTSSTGKP